jgi:hypothetical protein
MKLSKVERPACNRVAAISPRRQPGRGALHLFHTLRLWQKKVENVEVYGASMLFMTQVRIILSQILLQALHHNFGGAQRSS